MYHLQSTAPHSSHHTSAPSCTVRHMLDTQMSCHPFATRFCTVPRVHTSGHSRRPQDTLTLERNIDTNYRIPSPPGVRLSCWVHSASSPSLVCHGCP
jgi:hypothetical protein